MIHPAGRIEKPNHGPLHTAREGQENAGRSQSDVRAEGSGRYGRPVLPDSLSVSRRGPVTLLRLSRPAKRNALDEATINGIESFFSDPPRETRAIIVYGEGKHFSAGADLSAFVEDHALARVRYSRAWHRAFDWIENGGLPVIAVLHGAVIGGGLELAASAHIRVAERSACYALPESARGIFVGGGGAVRIPRLIGTSRMIDMMLTGRTYSAAEGASLGFSQYVVDDGEGLTKAIELAERIATNTTLSNFAIVQALPRIARSGPDGGFLTESLMASITLDDGEAKARINAFLEKRGPKTGPLSAEG
jgi:enoyl-CoA hydratase/carnithine racemase